MICAKQKKTRSIAERVFCVKKNDLAFLVRAYLTDTRRVAVP